MCINLVGVFHGKWFFINFQIFLCLFIIRKVEKLVNEKKNSI
jgi:hypothetical protein